MAVREQPYTDPETGTGLRTVAAAEKRRVTRVMTPDPMRSRKRQFRAGRRKSTYSRLG